MTFMVRSVSGILFAMTACLALASCKSSPPSAIQATPQSSILAVDLGYIDPMLGLDFLAPKVEQVLFLRGQGRDGKIDPRIAALPASWVVGRRAYLLNPEPGVYYVVASTYRVEVQQQSSSVSSGNTTVTVSTGGSFGHTIIFPDSFVQQTRTEVRAGEMAVVGKVRVLIGDRVNAQSTFQDEQQKLLTQQLRPTALTATGVSGYFTMTWMVDQSKSTVVRDEASIADLRAAAQGDFEGTAWSSIAGR